MLKSSNTRRHVTHRAVFAVRVTGEPSRWAQKNLNRSNNDSVTLDSGIITKPMETPTWKVLKPVQFNSVNSLRNPKKKNNQQKHVDRIAHPLRACTTHTVYLLPKFGSLYERWGEPYPAQQHARLTALTTTPTLTLRSWLVSVWFCRAAC